MKIVRINPLRPDPRLIREAALVLKRGGLVVYPTETAYALGCDAKNARAMRRIRTVKGREKSKPLPLIAASLSMATRLANFDVFSLALAKKHWPGPLTLILPVPRKFTTVNFLGTGLAVRVSSHPTAHALATALGRPIVSTSANRSGAPTKYDVASVLADLGTAPDLVLDAGRLAKTKTSTIVRCNERGCEVLRDGPISLATILKTLRACA